MFFRTGTKTGFLHTTGVKGLRETRGRTFHIEGRGGIGSVLSTVPTPMHTPFSKHLANGAARTVLAREEQAKTD